MEKTDVVEEFYGVYLLKCMNPKYTGRTYIGYTVDPNRRIKQHNKGRLYGGAWRTSQRGPWEMVLTVHGFPSDVAALRFEWAWQHPKRSRRLKTLVPNKKASESSLDYRLKLMFTMLTVPPWCRLPLTLRWLNADSVVEPPPCLAPPVHMPIVYGPVVSKKLKSPKKKSRNSKESKTEVKEAVHVCHVCDRVIEEEERLSCLNSDCSSHWHLQCLAKRFLDEELSCLTSFGSQISKERTRNILPMEGSCSHCDSVMLWGDLVRKKKGCYNQILKGSSSQD